MNENEIEKLAYEIAAEFQSKTQNFIQGSDYHYALILIIKKHLREYDPTNTKS